MINSIEINCKPVENSLIPHSTGHLLYSATLNTIQDNNPELSGKIHSSSNSKISVTPLNGEFDRKDSNRKRVFQDTEYNFFINLIDTKGFQELFQNFVLKGEKLEVAGKQFEITGMNTEEITWQDLMEKKTPESLYFHFMSPVCIKYKNSDVTEMFPHREAVFKSLENSWNQHAPKQMQFQINTEKLKKHVIEKSYTHNTANTVVTRKKDGENKRQIKEFGFTGKTEYAFKNAPDQLKKKLSILTQYAKHKGLGSHTARGLGNTYTEVNY